MENPDGSASAFGLHTHRSHPFAPDFVVFAWVLLSQGSILLLQTSFAVEARLICAARIATQLEIVLRCFASISGTVGKGWELQCSKFRNAVFANLRFLKSKAQPDATTPLQ